MAGGAMQKKGNKTTTKSEVYNSKKTPKKKLDMISWRGFINGLQKKSSDSRVIPYNNRSLVMI
jgi:hypothetical protein